MAWGVDVGLQGNGAKTPVIVCLSVALAGYATAAAAQTLPSGQGAATLPPVTVDAPKQRAQSRGTAPRTARAARTARPRVAPGPRGPQSAPHVETAASRGTFQQGNGPIQGYVPHRTLAGTKTNTPILEVPQSVSVIGTDQIRDQGARSVVQAVGYTPGIVTNSPNDTRFESIFIRGFQAQLFLDGMRLPYGAASFGQPKLDLALLERVEVLRGPGSSLYGQAPPGGFVNMVSRLPTASPLNSFELLADNWGKVQANFDVGGVGAVNQKGDLFWRIAGTIHDGGTQTDFVNDFRGAIAPSFTYKPDLDTTFTFLSGYQRDITGLALQFFPSQGTLYSNPNGRIPLTKFLGEPGFDHFDRTQAWVGYQFEHSFNEVWTVRQNVRYFDLETNTYAVAGGGAIGSAALPNTASGDFSTLNRAAFSFPEDASSVTLDNQAEARFTTGALAHTALFGVDYRHIDSQINMTVGAAPQINLYNTVYGAAIAFPTTTTNHSSQVQDQTGLYLQDQVALGRWRLTLTGRSDWVTTDSMNFVTNKQTTQNDQAFTGRAGLNYIFDSGIAPYIAYATSFQPTLGVTVAGGAPVPTTAQQAEIGVKYQAAGTNLLLTAALFDLTQQNVVTPSAIVGFSDQTGEARSRGGEFEAQVSLTEGLKLLASYAYTDTLTTKTNTPSQLNKHLIVQPMNQAALWADYTFQQGQLTGFGFGGGVRYIGDSYGDLANTLSIPSYTLFDVAVHYDLSNLDRRLRGVTLAVNATNLFDKYYVSWCSTANSCFLGSGRTVIGSVRYTWN
ncbi:TonB-dependent siderophore receptor [Bradyrhizobium genosp. L]|uniref:TonB-dependent siderophore receptor n=1 Tax=Bradyrhizobium genosp. L TaxID=83637 RepID=UPI0018A2E342|nr:TonB-dependent siderophore receptor [Bradyrhizobium genosp. L]QPF84081.1 TonB-dependent siderophore receptor [Bradyrhizobium genosp. L]